MLCREHGQQLSELAATADIHLFGVVKEVDVDNEGLYDFYKQYFPFDLYRDVDLSLYRLLGNKKLRLKTWNPIRLYRGYRALQQRLDSKNLTGNLKGEGLVLGGIVIFNKEGKVHKTIVEETGTPLDMDEIKEAVQQVQGATEKEL